MDNDFNISPMHLEDQMARVLARAIRDTFEMKESSDASKAKPVVMKVRTNYEKEFLDVFGCIRSAVLLKISSGNARGLDSHKLAAIACLSVLRSRPLYIEENGDGHSVNELVAFLMAIDVIRRYQVNRVYPGDKGKQERLRDNLGKLDTPPLIYDSQPVSINTIFAFRHLSRALRQPNCQPVDFALLLSSFFFFIDACSYNAVKTFAA